MAALVSSSSSASRGVEAEDDGLANRERWHWCEVDLSDWVRRWLEMNIEDVVLVETETLKVKCRNAYKDSGECLLHCRKGEFFATYSMDLVVKWVAHRLLDGRILGEARGRVRANDISSTVTDGSAAELVVEGDWQYRRPTQQQQQPLGGNDMASDEVSDVELSLKASVSDKATSELARRLERLRLDLAAIAAAYQRGSRTVPEPVSLATLPDFDADGPQRRLRAEESTRRLVKDLRAKLRSPAFEATIDDLADGSKNQAVFRSMSLTDDDIPSIVAALEGRRRREQSIMPLVELDLGYNDITDAGLQPLICAIATGAAPGLKRLTLDRTKLTEVACRQLEGLKCIRRSLEVSAENLAE